MTDRRLVAVTAGLGTPSSSRLLTDRLAAASENALREHGLRSATQVIELRDHAQELVNHLLTGFPAPRLRESLDAVLAADGLIAVTPVFSASYSGLFKLFFDLLERDGLAGSTVLIGATGGTARHSLALEHAVRPLFTYLGASVLPTSVYAAAEDWGESEMPAEAGLAARIERAGVELGAVMAGRPRPQARDPFADPVSFEELRDTAGGPG